MWDLGKNMHEPVIDSIEAILAGTRSAGRAERHLSECSSCRDEVAAMLRQTEMLRGLRAPADVEPTGGFYARVMNRIEAQAKPSIWNIFGESMFAKRLAYASMTFVALLGSYVISSTRSQSLAVNAPEAIMAGDTTDDQKLVADNNPERDREAILVTLATYEE